MLTVNLPLWALVTVYSGVQESDTMSRVECVSDGLMRVYAVDVPPS